MAKRGGSTRALGTQTRVMGRGKAKRALVRDKGRGKAKRALVRDKGG